MLVQVVKMGTRLLFCAAGVWQFATVRCVEASLSRSDGSWPVQLEGCSPRSAIPKISDNVRLFLGGKEAKDRVALYNTIKWCPTQSQVARREARTFFIGMTGVIRNFYDFYFY
jgi:hypothetical protein